MDQNTCNVCHKSFNSEQELREHQRNAHSTGTGTDKKQQDRPSGELNQPNRGEQHQQGQPGRGEQNQPGRGEQNQPGRGEQGQPNRGEQNPQPDRGGERKIAS